MFSNRSLGFCTFTERAYTYLETRFLELYGMTSHSFFCMLTLSAPTQKGTGGGPVIQGLFIRIKSMCNTSSMSIHARSCFNRLFKEQGRYLLSHNRSLKKYGMSGC